MTEISIIKQATINIRYKNKSVFDLVVRVTKDDGSVYDMTGHELRMDIKKNWDASSYLYRLTDSDGITITESNLLTFSKVMELPNDTYVYDLKDIDDDYFIMGGLIKVERNATT